MWEGGHTLMRLRQSRSTKPRHVQMETRNSELTRRRGMLSKHRPLTRNEGIDYGHIDIVKDCWQG
jgi:hypothetical protein